jgi:hypothetical protein
VGIGGVGNGGVGNGGGGGADNTKCFQLDLLSAVRVLHGPFSKYHDVKKTKKTY